MSPGSSNCPRCGYEIGVLGAAKCSECGLDVQWVPVGSGWLQSKLHWIVVLLVMLALVNATLLLLTVSCLDAKQEAHAARRTASSGQMDLIQYRFQVINRWMQGDKAPQTLPPDTPALPVPTISELTLDRLLRVLKQNWFAAGWLTFAALLSAGTACFVEVPSRRAVRATRRREIIAVLLAALATTLLGVMIGVGATG